MPTRELPLYQQVADRIVSELGSSFTTGSRLPSERSLCERFGVSRITLRNALNQLAEHGVITASPARGWFVQTAIASPSRTGTEQPDVTGFTDLARSLGQATTAKVLACTTRPATLDEADLFAIVPGAAVFELRRLRLLEGLVIAVDSSRVPAALCPGIADHDYATESLYRTLRSAPDPIRPTVADYAVEAVAPTAEETALLDLPAGVPLLVATQQTRDQYARLFELGRTSYRGDRYRFRASLGAPQHPARSAPGRDR